MVPSPLPLQVQLATLALCNVLASVRAEDEIYATIDWERILAALLRVAGAADRSRDSAQALPAVHAIGAFVGRAPDCLLPACREAAPHLVRLLPSCHTTLQHRCLQVLCEILERGDGDKGYGDSVVSAGIADVLPSLLSQDDDCIVSHAAQCKELLAVAGCRAAVCTPQILAKIGPLVASKDMGMARCGMGVVAAMVSGPLKNPFRKTVFRHSPLHAIEALLSSECSDVARDAMCALCWMSHELSLVLKLAKPAVFTEVVLFLQRDDLVGDEWILWALRFLQNTTVNVPDGMRAAEGSRAGTALVDIIFRNECAGASACAAATVAGQIAT